MPLAGKTTFIRMLHGSLKPDDESIEVPEFRVSYKPQKISPKFPGSVRPPAPVTGPAESASAALSWQRTCSAQWACSCHDAGNSLCTA